MTKSMSLIYFFCFVYHIGFSQSLDTSKLDSFFDTLEAKKKFMGSVAISKNGETIYSKTIGYSDIENKIKANQNTKYRIGSVSKSYTAVLIFKAVEADKIKLDQTIEEYFPSIKNANKITIKHLLGHRSGIHNFTEDADYLTWNTKPKTEKEMIDIISRGGTDFHPDNRAAYSNSNYVLLTYILEKAFKDSYSNLIKKYIVQPLGLKHTYVFGKINPVKNEAKSYKYIGSWNLDVETDHTVPLGAGAIISTPRDIIQFAEDLFTGKILKEKSLKKMKTIQDGYGLGLFQIPFYNSTGYGHTGGIDGFSSVYIYFPKDKIAYALCSNGTNYNNNDISIAVLSAIHNKTYEIPSFNTYELTSKDLEKYLGNYASEQIALKITITKKGTTLIAQGTGQPAFPLEAVEKDKFKFDIAGAKFEFKPDKGTMTLFQNGGEVNFKKE